MNRFKNYVLTAAGFAALVMTVGVFTAGHAIAQAVRAALVQNRDEPGRQPFTLLAGPSSAATWQVPAGKRYVIEEFGMTCVVDSANGGALSDVFVNIGALESHAPAPHSVDYDGPGRIFWAASTTTRLYVDPGYYINLWAITNNIASGAETHGCKGSVTGYSIDLS